MFIISGRYFFSFHTVFSLMEDQVANDPPLCRNHIMQDWLRGRTSRASLHALEWSGVRSY